jgi:hypothetical protein
MDISVNSDCFFGEVKFIKVRKDGPKDFKGFIRIVTVKDVIPSNIIELQAKTLDIIGSKVSDCFCGMILLLGLLEEGDKVTKVIASVRYDGS